jgi:hypothetical protein
MGCLANTIRPAYVMSKALTLLHSLLQRAQACRMNEGGLWRFAMSEEREAFHGLFNVSEQFGGE